MTMHEPQLISAKLRKPRRKNWAPRVKTGCGTCRKRRVKCDEAKPCCRRCSIAMLKCPGYLFDGIEESILQLCVPPLPCSVPLLNGTEEMRDILALLPKINLAAPNPADDACRNTRLVIQSLMHDIPSRIGHSSAIYAATRCFAGALQEIWPQLETNNVDTIPTSLMTTRTRSRYTAALSVLNDALNDPCHSTTMETLIAAQLLCCFETFQETCFEAASRHMFGISRIIEHMGPQRFTTQYEVDMLIGQLPSIACASYIYNIPCLIEKREWSELFMREESRSKGRVRYEIGGYRMAGTIYTLFAETTALIEDSQCGQVNPVWHISLLQRLRYAQHLYRKWHFRWMEHLSATHSDIDTISVIEECHKNPETNWVVKLVGMNQGEALMYLRLPVALGCENALQMEERTQAYAKRLLSLYDKYKDDPTFMRPQLTCLLATKIIETSDEWRKFAVQAEEARSADKLCLLPEYIWTRWLRMVYIGHQRAK